MEYETVNREIEVDGVSQSFSVTYPEHRVQLPCGRTVEISWGESYPPAILSMALATTPVVSPRGLYRFCFPSYNSVDGLFTATADEVTSMVGKCADFGEADGKHSHVQGRLEAGHFTLVTVDADFVSKFDEYECASGCHPKHAIEEYEESNRGYDE